MKKQITAITALTLTALTLTAALLAGCSNTPNTPNPAQGGDSTTTQSVSTTTESTESTESTTESIPIASLPDAFEEGRFIYGEKEIPDMIYPEYNETDGRYIAPMAHSIDRGLESMVFETHTHGDYTIRLVGHNVRTDKEHFPGAIYVLGLGIEIEKDGKLVTDKYDHNAGYATPYNILSAPENIIYEDQIGSYLDIYDLKYPTIAMRYRGRDGLEEPFRKTVQFCWIEDNELVCDFLGVDDNNANTIAANIGYGGLEFSSGGYFAIFAADEFKVENENTLVDETAGIKYIFDFDKTDDSGHYFSTEKIQ